MKQMTTSEEVQTQVLQKNSALGTFASYNEMSDIPVSYKNLEEEFTSRLALVEDLQKRFHFMMTELKSAGLRADD